MELLVISEQASAKNIHRAATAAKACFNANHAPLEQVYREVLHRQEGEPYNNSMTEIWDEAEELVADILGEAFDNRHQHLKVR
jgi:hypothetical protein